MLRKMLCVLSIGVLVVLSLSAVQAKEHRIKTDGKNKKSPIKVLSLNFSDGGGSSVVNPDLYPIRTSVVIKNTSSEDDLKNVDVKLMLQNGAGQTVKEWKKHVGVLKAGATFKLEPGPYYNYNRIPLHAAVEVEHDPVKKDEKGKKE